MRLGTTFGQMDGSVFCCTSEAITAIQLVKPFFGLNFLYHRPSLELRGFKLCAGKDMESVTVSETSQRSKIVKNMIQDWIAILQDVFFSKTVPIVGDPNNIKKKVGVGVTFPYCLIFCVMDDESLAWKVEIHIRETLGILGAN